jgi:hypothetical protein
MSVYIAEAGPVEKTGPAFLFQGSGRPDQGDFAEIQRAGYSGLSDLAILGKFLPSQACDFVSKKI